MEKTNMTEERVYASEFSPEEWREARRDLTATLDRPKELIRAQEAQEKADFFFPKGARIRPQDPQSKRYYGWRTLREVIFANHVLDEKGKPLKAENLCVWEALNDVQIWDGKGRSEYSLLEKNRFLAFTENAQRNRGRKEK